MSKSPFRAYSSDQNSITFELEKTSQLHLALYRVEFKALNSPTWNSSPRFTPYQTVTINNLKKGSQYTVRLVMTTKIGDIVTTNARIVTVGESYGG